MIEVRNLVKNYGNHVAVDHLNFNVEDGYIYGFLGPNGAGKSTTMNMMTGYLGATSGDVIVNGHNILEEPEAAKRNIGYLPEIPPLYTDMTVMEYLQFAAELKKIAKAGRKEEIARAISVTKLEEVKHRLIRNLSKGYKQRVGLAQAILGMPPVIILDEPTVGLDPKQIIEIRDLIKELGKQHTVILSSHILSEVRAVCDRVMIIAHGKLVASDTPENLESQLVSGHVMELVVKGTSEQILEIMNHLECRAYIEQIEIKEGENEEEKIVSFSLVGLQGYGKDARECIFYGFAEARCPIVKMVEQKKTLEEVFLELTEGDMAVDGESSLSEDQSLSEEQGISKAQSIRKEEYVNEDEGMSQDGNRMEDKKHESNI